MPLCQVTIRIFPIFEVVCEIKELFHWPKYVVESEGINFRQYEPKCKDNGIRCSRTVIDKSYRNWKRIEKGWYIFILFLIFFNVLNNINFRVLKNLLKKCLKRILVIAMQWDKSQLHSYARYSYTLSLFNGRFNSNL